MTPAELASHRKRIKTQRAQLSQSAQQTCSDQALKHLLRQLNYRSAQHIALYWPVRGELNPLSLRQQALPWQHYYLPIVQRHTRCLRFVGWQRDTYFRPNRFAIPEPYPPYQHSFPARALDIVITPLVAFDDSGTRIGMGGGFYDTSFAFKNKPSTQHWRPLLIGLAYEFQYLHGLIRQPWDVKLDAIVTEKGVYWC